MKKYLIPIIAIVLVFCFTFSTFALSSYNYTLKDFLGINGSSISTYRRSQSGASYGAEYLWDSNYSLRLFTSGSDSPANTAYGLDVRSSFNGGDTSPILDFNNNDVIIFSAPRLRYEYTTTSTTKPSQSFFILDITFGFRDKIGDLYDVQMYNSRASSTGLDNGTVAVHFDDVKFDYSVPINYVSLEYMRVEIRSVVLGTAVGSDVVLASSDDVLFYVGGRSDAPLYNSPDKSTVDQFYNQENELISDTSGGRENIGNIFNRGKNFFEGGLGIMEGTLAVSSILTLFASALNVEGLIYLSLALGIFAFVVGMGQYLIANEKSRVSAEKTKQYRQFVGRQYARRSKGG